MQHLSINFIKLLELAGVIEITQQGQSFIVSDKAFVQVEKEFKPLLSVFTSLQSPDETALKEFEKLARETKQQIRFVLAEFEGRYSKETFLRSKCICRIDIDKNLPISDVIAYIETLPLIPTAFSKTNKGWHIFYFSEEFITADEDELIDAIINFRDLLKNEYSHYKEDKVVDAVHSLYQVMTRYSDEIYFIHAPHKKNAIVNMLNTYKERDGLVKSFGRYRTIPLNTLTEHTFTTAVNSCPIMQAIESNWEWHGYNDWFIARWKYVVLAHITGDYEKYKNEFIQKSLRWKRGEPKLDDIIYQFDYAYKHVKQGDGVLYFSCERLNELSEYGHLCNSCRLAKKKNGKLVSSFLRELLDISIQDFEFDAKTGFWYKVEHNRNGETRIPVCEYFVIEDFIQIHKESRDKSKTKNLLKIRTHHGVHFIELKNLASGHLDLSQFAPITYLYPFSSKDNHIKQFLVSYVNKYIKKHGKRYMDFVGYRFDIESRSWNRKVANLDGLSPEYVLYYMYGVKDRTSSRRYYPEVVGDYEKWAEIYRQLFRQKEPITLLLIGYFLTHFTNQYLRNTSLSPELNCVVVLRGYSGTGKTTRLKLASSLFGPPSVIDISEVTSTMIAREFGYIKVPLPLDEVRRKLSDGKDFVNLIYLTANEGFKAHSYDTFAPIDVPLVLSGEPQNLPLEEMMSVNEGLFRRLLVITLDDRTLKHHQGFMTEANDELIRTLIENHGFAYKFVEYLERLNWDAIHERINNLYKQGWWRILTNALLKRKCDSQKVRLLSPLDNLLARIHVSLDLFGIMLDLSEEERGQALESVTNFVNESIASFYEVFLPRERNLEEELYEFVVNLVDRLYKLREDKNIATPVTLYGKTINQLLHATQMQTPTAEVLHYAKLLLFKRKDIRRMYVFTGSVLVSRIDEDALIKKEINRLIENVKGLSEAERHLILSTYFKVAKSVLSNKVYESLVDSWRYYVYDLDKYLEDDPEGGGPKNGVKDEALTELEEHFCDYQYVKTAEKLPPNGEPKPVETKPAKTVIALPPQQTTVKASASLPDVKLVKAFSEIEEKLNHDSPIYFDIEADIQTKRPVLITLYQEGWKPVYAVDLRGKDLKQVREWLLKFRTLSGYGLNFDFTALEFSYGELKDKDVLDLMLLAKEKLYRRYTNGKSEFSLDKILKDVLKVDYAFDKDKIRKGFKEGLAFTKEQLLYAACDVFFLPKLYSELSEGGLSIVQELDQEALKVCVETSQLGLPFLKDKALERLKSIQEEFEAIKRELKFNPLSPHQVKKVLMLEDTREETLQEYILNNGTRRDIAEKVLRARKLSKEISMIEAYLKHGDRVKGTFWTTGAISGRMSCSDDNLQQIPRNLRDLFGFPEGEGKVLITADFPQIELRLAGANWKEQKFVKAFREGIDLHKLTASILYDKPLDAITKEERQIGKAANFGLIYGIGAKGFQKYCIASGINIDENTAIEIKRRFFGNYTQIKKIHEYVREWFKTHPTMEGQTWLGRKYVAGKPQEMLNYQIQGSGAELFKRAIVELKRKYPTLRIVNLVHDEIVIEADRDQAEEIAMVVKAEMEAAWSWCVAEAKKLGKDIEEFGLEVEPPNVSNVWEKG